MRFACHLLLTLAIPLAAHTQDTPRLKSADGRPMEFDVVSVKPSRSASTDMGIASPPMSDGITIQNMPPEHILQAAFGLYQSDRIVGLPAWATQERYDVSARVSDADVALYHQVIDPIQRAPMLQKILVDRFNLKSHFETKELTVYALVVAKGGSKMTEIQPASGPNGIKDGGSRHLGRGSIQSMGQPLKPLVNALTQQLGQPIVDRTGLTGYYNFTLTWTPEGLAPTANENSNAPSIFTALQEQLGLKLERVKAPMQILVIDHIERPSEN